MLVAYHSSEEEGESKEKETARQRFHVFMFGLFSLISLNGNFLIFIFIFYF